MNKVLAMNKALALAATETKLVLRNKTVAVSSVVLPLALGLFWVFSFGGDADPVSSAVVVALQLAVGLSMGIYVTATQTLVARRHTRVLTRLRTSGLSDTELLVATVAPSVAIGGVQLAIFALINFGSGIPLPADPLALALAMVGGVVLVVTAALATSIVTPSPERAQITTLPLTFVLLGTSIVTVIAPTDGWLQALVALPGAAIGQFTGFAFSGDAWVAGLGGLPALLPGLAALLVWPVIFAVLARRRFRWDPRA